jgi:uncharacterized cupredoxin-like copper-binding protein
LIRLRRIAVLSAALAFLGASAADARPRVHRLRVPPPPVEVLPSSLLVDMSEWYIRPSRIRVKAGEVAIGAFNRGMDDHDLTMVDAAGALQTVPLMANGGQGRLVVNLTPGRYKLYCSLFAGTPSSHEVFGMVTYITAK